jgi:hypothetical protein
MLPASLDDSTPAGSTFRVKSFTAEKEMFTSPKRRALLSVSLLATGLLGALATIPNVSAQAPPAAASTPAAANNLVGTVTTTSADAVTLKLENGSEATIAIGPQTRLLRTAPGEKTLKGATIIHMEDLTAGDRVLVLRATSGADAGHYTAAAIVTMKQADIAQAHAAEAADWQRRGVGGIVKTIETDPALQASASPSSGGPGATIVLSTPQPDRTLAIHLTPATVIRRYAPDSVNFADAKQATLADIHPGDQLRARGDKNEDGTQVTAVEIVAGSFRNVAGTITTIDPAQNTITVTDLATKKPVTLKLNSETQMRKLPPEMAQRLAARNGSGSSNGAGRPGAAPPTGSETHPVGEPGAYAGSGRGRGDTASMLQRAPLVTLAELKKGDAVMVVAAKGGGGISDAATAITLIAGVEPLLESSSKGASDTLFSASWNLSGGGGAAEAAPQ